MVSGGRCSAAAFVTLLLLAILGVSSAATYTVGDAQGWNLGVNYATWAAGKTFRAGDVLIFTYSQMHSVVEVTQADLTSCTITPINSYTSGNDSVTLSSTKSAQFFICGTSGHCNGGMALQITIGASPQSGAPAPAKIVTPPAKSPPVTSPAKSPPVTSPATSPASTPPPVSVAPVPSQDAEAPSSSKAPPSVIDLPKPPKSSPAPATETKPNSAAVARCSLVLSMIVAMVAFF